MAPYPAWPLMISVALIRVLLVIGLLYGALPYLLFPGFPDRGSAGMVGRGVIFLFAGLAVVHALGFMKLYEGLLLLALIASTLVWRFYLGLDPARRQASLERLGLWALQWIDRLTGRRKVKVLSGLEWFSLPRPRVTWTEGAVLLAIVTVVAWMLFDGAYRHASPAFSDAPVTLKWMKDFGVGRLYADGVYPQGMYGFLSMVRKLSAQPDFLVMSVSGPLVGLAMAGGLALFLRWCTGSTLAAGVGLLLYGTAPQMLPVEYARHVGYNSQEFGVLFALPAAWFAFQYLRGGNRGHGLSAAAAAGITVFVHPVAAFICIVLLGGAGVAALALRALTWRRILTLLGLGLTAGVIGALPPLVGLVVLKQGWHGSSAAFLADSTEAGLFRPPLAILALMGAGLLAPLLLRRLREPGVWLAWSVSAAALAAWLIPHLVPLEAMNTIAHRSGEAGAMGIAIAAGIAAAGLERYLPAGLGSPVGKSAVLGAVALVTWAVWAPTPPAPPRVSTDNEIMQALRVDRESVRGEWLLVMGEMGYSLALEHGYHQYPDDFLKAVRLRPDRACWAEEDGALQSLPLTVALFLDPAEPQYPALKAWIDANRESAPLSRIFADPALEVWLLKYKPGPQEQFDAVWENRSVDPCSQPPAG